MYTIEIEYKTGNSFGSSEATDTIGREFETKEEARIVLGLIKEHYEMYNAINNCYSFHATGTKKQTLESFKDKPWFHPEYYEQVLIYNGQNLSCFWCGYFESLRSATVIVVSDEDKSLDSYYP